MYVVKAGEYYVRDVDIYCGNIGEIILSQEIMRQFKNKPLAEIVAKKVNGKLIEMADEVTNAES